MRQPIIAALLIALALPALPAGAARDPVSRSALFSAIGSPARAAADRARDKYRHPLQTLTFFGVTPDQTVVEYLPSGGWYTAILAPLLKEHGHYIALSSSAPKAQADTAAMLAKRASWLGKDAQASVDYATGATSIAPGSVDTILTFRNIHNLVMADDGRAARVLAAFFKALKPGGTLGIVDHRLPETRDSALQRSSGYLKRSTIVKLATDAGFRLVGESQVNANPKDKADYPQGVWTLPPTLKLGDTDRARYLTIGESDRMTLRFVKPKA